MFRFFQQCACEHLSAHWRVSNSSVLRPKPLALQAQQPEQGRGMMTFCTRAAGELLSHRFTQAWSTFIHCWQRTKMNSGEI